MRTRLLALLLTVLPLTAANLAKPESVGMSEERLRRIHDTMKAHIDSHDITGAVTLVSRKGQIVHLQAHGLADVEGSKPMKTDAIFRVYSMSKPVTGVAIMMLLEEGKVRLNDPVSRFIPEFKGVKVVPEGGGEPVAAKREVTIGDLLTHISGLASAPKSGGEVAKLMAPDKEPLAAIVPKMAGQPLDFQPGTRWAYSAIAAFDTLGRVVEIVSGMTFDQFLKKRLFEPLGMNDTAFHPGDARWPRVVTPYARKDGTLVKPERANFLISKVYFSGAGGLTSTAEDYAKFAQMLCNGGQLNGKRILSPKTVELMSSVFVPDTMPGRAPGRSFGLSVQVINDPVKANQRVSAGSFGWDGAFGTHFWVDPKEKIVGLMLVQTTNPDRQVDRDFENAVMQAVVE